MKFLCSLLNPKKLIIPVIAMSFTLISCTTHVGRFTMASSKNIEFSDKESELVKENVTGKSYCKIYFLFPTCMYPQVHDAMDNALEESDGDFMKDISIKTSWWWIPYIYGKHTTHVEGDLYKLKEKEDSKKEEKEKN